MGCEAWGKPKPDGQPEQVLEYPLPGVWSIQPRECGAWIRPSPAVRFCDKVIAVGVQPEATQMLVAWLGHEAIERVD